MHIVQLRFAQKAHWIYEDEAEPNMQASYIKIMENIFVSSLWKASTFDSTTRMVVILLVYIKWFLYHELFMIILISCPKNM